MQTYDHLNAENREWLNDLNFYHDEIKFFQNKLVEIMNELSVKNKEKANQFKKNFLARLKDIDDLRQKVYKAEKHLAARMELASRMKLPVEEDHHSVKTEIEQFSAAYQSLKNDFNHFVSQAV